MEANLEEDRDAENEGEQNFKQTHKEIYGLLLVINHRLFMAGFMTFSAISIVALFLCASIHMRWFDSILDVPVDPVRGLGTYALIAGMAFLVYIGIARFRENRIYQEARPDLQYRLQHSGISVEDLLGQITPGDKLRGIESLIRNDIELQETLAPHHTKPGRNDPQ